MCRLARESIFADRPSIPHRPSVFPPLPIFSRSPAHTSHRQLFRTRTYTRETISHLMNTGSIPPPLPPTTVDRSHQRCRRLPIGLPHHTPCRLCRRAGLPTGCLSIPPHSACSSCLSPAAACNLSPGRTRRHETIGTARETWARWAIFPSYYLLRVKKLRRRFPH